MKNKVNLVRDLLYFSPKNKKMIKVFVLFLFCVYANEIANFDVEEQRFFEKFSKYFFEKYGNRLIGPPGYPCDVIEIDRLKQRISELEKKPSTLFGYIYSKINR